ncbi:tannase/feruloyl esterase family alpha/beta hydrolase [Aquincola sp. MAHUQ-54]|uniref:Tannase/feruloyl esterase family alpha/beta hydrolase n=1 Tax=Aquincola agrisoli TaxID=3119538 RepID=A0AAW9QPR3_9BURK
MNTRRFLAAMAVVVGALLTACGGDGGGDAAPAATTLGIVKPASACTSLASVDLTDIGGVGSAVTSATEGTVAVNGADVKFCTVEGTLAPAIGFRVRLPIDTWTQRVLHIGCGGLCGSISASVEPGTSYGCPLVQSGGFVLSSTNMGHTGADANWSQDAQKRVDFAYRGVHATTLAAKKLTQAYYGQKERYAYFVGCSDGGREGLMAAQRHADDYDGIVAGAPAFLFNVQNSLHHGWMARSNRDNGLSTGNVVLYPAKAAMLHAAVVAACDPLDGQADGLLTDPRTCSFDPATLQCPAGAADTRACLTATEVATVSKFYNGPRDPSSNRRILVGGPQYGSELNWAGVFVPANDTVTNRVGSDNFVNGARYVIFDDATPPTLDELEFTEAFYGRLRTRHPLNDATNPDLSAFKDAGGKLILWHGWADQHISPINTIAYHEAMQKTMGQASMDTFMRMYLAPGVGHCGSGEGLPNMDLVTALVNWVEGGKAPDAIHTVRTDAAGNVTASRPMYPYPEVARYDGKGDPAAASSYTRGAALYTTPTPDWAGIDFFSPYAAAPL